MSDLLFVVGVIYVLVNLTLYAVGIPSSQSWTRVLLEVNGFLTALIFAAATPWIVLAVLGITNFKLYFGITIAVWTGIIFGLVKYLMNAKPLQR